MRFVLPSGHSVPTVPRLENVELGSEHLVSLPDDTEVRLRRLIAEELFPLSPPSHLPRPSRHSRDEEVTARSQAPPPVNHVHLIIVGVLTFTLVWNVVMGAYRAYASDDSRPTAPVAAAGGGTNGIAPVPIGAVARRCVASAPRVLSRSVLVRGGVEAAASDNRIGLGVVKGPRDGIALELDATSGTVTASTKVVASDPLLRVLPSLEPVVPLDATPEIGPLHALGAAGDGEAYETGVLDGFLVWHARARDSTSRLWPMVAEIEVPHLARAGDEHVLVFRRDDEIWMGVVQVERDGARPGALVRVSDPAVQVGAPAIDARGDSVIAAWTQRDAHRGPWTLRWTRWRHGARAGALQRLSPLGAENAIAPSVAALADGSFLLSWTEGGAGHHRVRAQLFGPNDQPVGTAFDVSAAGVDAGQAQIALAAEGRGAAGYLVARGSGFDLVATPIACQ